MLKRILIIVGLIALIFVLGLWAENKIKKTNLPKVEIKKEKVKVSRVIDGDTIELSDKRKVRYIGVNSPEATDTRANVKCLAQKAKEANQKLVEGKEIELEKDLSETDKYGRLLRYVWIDNEMVNKELVEEGWAEIDTYPPDLKYQEMFLNLEKEAKVNKLGIWGEICQ